MRSLIVPLLAAVSLLVPAAASAQSTTRIETRPFYGATVTLEEGVRVFRPLPPHDRVIINPGGKTPLNLTLEEQRSVSHNYNYEQGTASSGDGAHGGTSYEGGGYGHRGGHKSPYAARKVNGIPARSH